MAERKLTIMLTDDQQKQIRDVTGKSITELSIDLAPAELGQAELDAVSGGTLGHTAPVKFQWE